MAADCLPICARLRVLGTKGAALYKSLNDCDYARPDFWDDNLVISRDGAEFPVTEVIAHDVPIN